jgi:hypothetical protein
MTNLQYTTKEIRSATILTNSYVAANVLWQNDNNRIQELNQSVLFIDFTIWSLTSMELKIEYSDDGVNYYQQSFIDVSWGTATVSAWEYTFTASWSYEISNPFKAKFIKISVKWTWTVTWSSCTIKWVIWIA